MIFRNPIIELLYDDKIFMNQVLGKCTCKSLYQSYTTCKEAKVSNPYFMDPCGQLQQLSEKCYQAPDVDSINQYIQKRFKETYNLYAYLKERNPVILQHLLSNNWSIFYNKKHLERFNKIKNSIKQ